MKTTTLILAGMAFAFACTSQAEEGKNKRPHHHLPPEIIEEFDKDGDGKLNEEERKAARGAIEKLMKARKQEMLDKFDKNGDGELNKEEREAMREEMKKRALEKFDRDGNGVLDEEEKEAMKKELKGRPRHLNKEGEKPNRPEKKPDGGGEAPGVLGD